MSPEALKFIGQLIVAVIGGGVVVAIINNFLSPKTKAETKQIAQQTAQATIDQALTTLRADNADLRVQMAAARDQINSARSQADLAEKKADEVEARDRLLVDYLWDCRAWMKRWYDGGHPPGMLPPPEPPAELRELLKT